MTPGEKPSGGGGLSQAHVVQIAAGDFHTCARYDDGTLQCWGRDRDGELGDSGSGGDRTRATPVAGVNGVQEIALGSNFTCARLAGGSVSCWGSGKILGDAREVERVPPTKVPGLEGVVELRAGGYVACARTAAGAVRCWGADEVQKGAPTADVVEIAVGAVHACGRLKDGSVRCWGEGPWSASAQVSFAKPSITGATAISTGDAFACAVVAGGAVQCWGRDDQGELGVNPDEDNHVKPVAVRGVQSAVRIASAESHTCVWSETAPLRCWGDNEEGELGRGTRTTQELADSPKGIEKVKGVALGADHLCALVGASITCWGGNKNGQLGDGTTERRLVP